MDDATLTLRVVQIGLGLWGRSWADVVRDAEGAELAAALGLVESIESGAPVEITAHHPRGRRG